MLLDYFYALFPAFFGLHTHADVASDRCNVRAFLLTDETDQKLYSEYYNVSVVWRFFRQKTIMLSSRIHRVLSTLLHKRRHEYENCREVLISARIN